MRIETAGTAASPAIEQATRNAPSSGAARSHATVEDRATFSSGSQTVKALVAQAMQTPAVRHDVVDAARQSIQSGTYPVDAQAIAAGIASESDI